MVKNAFSPKNLNYHTNKKFSIEEHVLIEWRISIDSIIFISSFEVFVFLLGVKVVTLVLYTLFRFAEIVKDWNATESLAFDDVIV